MTDGWMRKRNCDCHGHVLSIRLAQALPAAAFETCPKTGERGVRIEILQRTAAHHG